MKQLGFLSSRRVLWLQCMAMALSTLISRLPLLRLMTSGDGLSSIRSSAGLVWISGLVVAELGALDSVAGATVFSATPAAPAHGTVGQPFGGAAFAITGATTVVRSYTTSNLPPGISMKDASLIGGIPVVNGNVLNLVGTPTKEGTYVVTVTAWDGPDATGHSATYPLMGAAGYSIIIASAVMPPVVPPPSFTQHPASVTQAAGGTVTLSSSALGTAVTYQWIRNGADIPGATGAMLILPSLQSSDAGDYTVRATNEGGSVVSRYARVTVAPLVPGKIANMSVRAVAGVGGNPLIVGFVVDGGSKRILLRAAGPTLGAFGVAGTLADPILVLHETVGGMDTIRMSNDNWADGGAADQLSTLFAQVGAFAFASISSKDAAMVVDLAGAHTAHVNSVDPGLSGVVLLEAYDTGAAISPRLVNISARNHAGAGSEALIAGFVLDGNQPKHLLIRGVGPTLAAFGVQGTMADPRIEVYESANGTNVLRASNDNWGDEQGAASAAAQVGGFALNDGSKDAALVLTLPSGAFTAVVTSADGTAGDALVEVYELP